METLAGSGTNTEVAQSSPVPEDSDDGLFEILKDKTFIQRAKAMWEEDVPSLFRYHSLSSPPPGCGWLGVMSAETGCSLSELWKVSLHVRLGLCTR